jgi:putative Mg2+ transporter-C (MgtC) family protein
VDWEIVGRIVVASGLAILVGIEREAAGQPAGLRTHVTVAVGACLFGIISTLGFEEFFARRETTNVQVDVTRVASNLPVGIGFLGAGLIFRSGGKVRNLTTAASIWAIAAVGLAVGVGNPQAALIATLALLVVLVLLRPVRALITRTLTQDRREVTIQLREGHDASGVLGELAEQHGVTVDEVLVGKRGGAPFVRASVHAKPQVDLSAVLSKLASRDDVVDLDDLPED